uniref:Iodothyronine deiodinase n=1 Tax=Sarcophilus harrisii TaxID=9305 RepID=G3VZ61_SARHA
LGTTDMWRLWVLLQVAWHVAVGKVQKILFPERMKRNLLSQRININQNPAFEYKDWGPTFFSIQYFFFVLKVRWQHLEDQALQGGLAPNSPVVTLSGESRRIWDFMNGQ